MILIHTYFTSNCLSICRTIYLRGNSCHALETSFHSKFELKGALSVDRTQTPFSYLTRYKVGFRNLTLDPATGKNCTLFFPLDYVQLLSFYSAQIMQQATILKNVIKYQTVFLSNVEFRIISFFSTVGKLKLSQYFVL